MFLGEGKTAEANKLLEDVLNRDPENAKAYVGKFMTEIQSIGSYKYRNINNEKQLSDMNFVTLNKLSLYRALDFADSEYKSELERIIGPIFYNEALKNMKHKDYKNALAILSSIPGYLDSKEIIKECYYHNGYNFEYSKKYSEAIDCYEKIRGYKDVDVRLEHCKKGIEMKQNKKGLAGLFRK